MTDQTITPEDKYRCATREVQMRRKVYPRWIKDGRMYETDARREIEIMSAIAEDYRRLERQGDLFEQ